MRAISVLANAKSNGHRKTHEVELGGAGRKYMHLTRGDLEHESVREVSRVRSSEEARRKAGGAKERRVKRAGPEPSPRQEARRRSKSKRRCNCGSYPCGAVNWGEWILIWVKGLSVESKRWREGARCNVMSTCMEEAFLGRSRAGREAALAGLNRRMRKTARTVVWEG